MNILIFSWRGLKHPNSGGAEIVTHQHAKYWVKNGHKVTIFTSKYEEAKTQEIIDGVTYYRSGHAVIGTHIRACWWYLYGNKENFDLVIDQFHGIPYFTPLYVRSKKLAFIHEVTKEIWFLNQLPKPFNYLVAVVGFYLEPLIFKIIYKNIEFLTVSNSTKNDLVNWGISKTKIHVVHNGVNIIKPYSLIKNSRPTITFLGALAKVKFWGFVSEKDKFKLLAKSQILLNPSIREGWGLVNIEANSVGTPVVGYNTQGTKDSVKNNKTGFLVKLGDVQGLANRVEQLVLDKNLYQKVSQECLNWSKKFNWNQQAKKSLKLISEELN